MLTANIIASSSRQSIYNWYTQKESLISDLFNQNIERIINEPKKELIMSLNIKIHLIIGNYNCFW